MQANLLKMNERRSSFMKSLQEAMGNDGVVSMKRLVFSQWLVLTMSVKQEDYGRRLSIQTAEMAKIDRKYQQKALCIRKCFDPKERRVQRLLLAGVLDGWARV